MRVRCLIWSVDLVGDGGLQQLCQLMLRLVAKGFAPVLGSERDGEIAEFGVRVLGVSSQQVERLVAGEPVNEHQRAFGLFDLRHRCEFALQVGDLDQQVRRGVRVGERISHAVIR